MGTLVRRARRSGMCHDSRMRSDTSPSPVPTPTPTDAGWYRDAVIYQVYIRSFRDSDGDGIGDIGGIRERLPYLRELGVDALWINPWYPSPQADAGYDVSDYRAIEPMFGTMDQARAMLDEAHELGLRVILDIVPNHTSDQHVWFQAALASEPGSVERARYHFRPGRGDDGSLPPNDWRSVFGGPAWTREPGPAGEWFLHLFASEQPDLNWDNPEVRGEFEDIVRMWFDLGVDGFRIDVAHGMLKDPEFPDLGLAEEQLLAPPATSNHPHWDRDGIHEIYRAWRRIADSYDDPRVFVAEAWVESSERLGEYLRPDELHTAFNFEFLRATWNPSEMRTIIDESLAGADAVDAPATWVLSNHDVVRHVSRYARAEQDRPLNAAEMLVGTSAPDLTMGTDRARAAALLMMALPGSVYVYQGDELGLPEVEDLPADVKQDPVFHRTSGEIPGRDGCRVPMPWNAAKPGYGFSLTEGDDPWLPQPAAWAQLAADAQAEDPASTLQLYRTALRIRRDRSDLGARSDLRWLEAVDRGSTLAFRRGERFACVVNTADTPIELPEGTVLLSSAPLDGDRLPGNAAAWIELP